jgi:hypothetical protein
MTTNDRDVCRMCGLRRSAPGGDRCAQCITEAGIDISPSMNIFSLFARLNYRAWTALAEFVDNSVQSFLLHRERFAQMDPPQRCVTVQIDFDDDGGEITVRDDAGGIAIADFARAFRVAEPPSDRNGLNEFGMGMKCAAFWFSSRWSVVSHSVLDQACREVQFDKDRILSGGHTSLPVRDLTPTERYGTMITLQDVSTRMPRGRSKAKVREFLGDIYRGFLRDGLLRLVVAGEECVAAEHAVLESPRCIGIGRTEGAAVCWRKEIRVDLPGGLLITGFAGLLAEGRRSHAGFALLRRGRVVDGFPGQRWMPEEIFGTRNSFESLRVFGELHFSGTKGGGFAVSSQKDQIDWNGFEDDAIDLIREQLDSEPLPILRQARWHRVPAENSPDLAEGLTEAVDRTGAALESGAAENHLAHVPPNAYQPQPKLATLPQDLVIQPRQYTVPAEGGDWTVEFSFVKGGDPGKWIDVRGASEDLRDSSGSRVVQIAMLVTHPFMRNFVRSESEHLEPILRLAAALTLAERSAKEAGVQWPATIRTRMNRILTDTLGHSMEDR